jgi:ADP-heptose:LPS heptosyltransferase
MMVGASKQINQFTLDHSEPPFDLTASLIKVCDVFVGAEGGMANIAYAVGTRTILTSDFVHQLYGPNGVIRKNKEPKLGPAYYTSDPNMHINLDPYLTDEQVADSMINLISRGV